MPTKTCPRCQVEKDKSEFHKHKAYADGLQTYCKDCMRSLDRKRTLVRALKLYGITFECYEALLIKQAGRCAICYDELVKMVFDHDHDTGIVRGLLCSPCNIAIGNMKDDHVIIQRAADYLLAEPEETAA